MDKYGKSFVSALSEHNIKYSIEDEDDTISIYIAISEDDEIEEMVYQNSKSFAFEVAFRWDVTEKERAILYEYINYVNCDLFKARFVYDIDSKTIEVRHYLDKFDSIDGDMYIFNALLPIMMFIKYGMFIDDVIEGKCTPAEAIDIINREDK